MNPVNWRKEKERSKGIGCSKSNAWNACLVLSGMHMGLNAGWQSVWCFPIFHYQAASPAARHYLLMTEWTAVLMDRWMGSLMNAWQVLCQSGRQSKTLREGRNHLDSRDTSKILHKSKSHRPPSLPTPPAYNQITALHMVIMRLLSHPLSAIMVGRVAIVSAGSNLEK